MSWFWYVCGAAAVLGVVAYASAAAMAFKRTNGLAWYFLRCKLVFSLVQIAGMLWTVAAAPRMFDKFTPDIGLTALGLFGAGLFTLLLAIAMRAQDKGGT